MDDVVVTKVVTAQVKSLESLLQELQSAVCVGILVFAAGSFLLFVQLACNNNDCDYCRSRLQIHAEKMMKTYTNACHLVSQDKRMTPRVCKLGGGPIPSIEGCLDGLCEIAYVYFFFLNF